MAIAPLPIQDLTALPYSFQEWLRQIQNSLGGISGTIPWTSISKVGSSLSEIATRPHNALQTIQGGGSSNYFHQTLNNYHSFGPDNLLVYGTFASTLILTQTSPGYILADGSGGIINIELPLLESLGAPTANIGRRFHVKCINATNPINILPSSSSFDEFENGTVAYTLSALNKSVTLYGWYDVAWPRGLWFIESAT